jgi:hypothetical protein
MKIERLRCRSWPKVFSGPVNKHNLWTRPRPFSTKYKSDYCFQRQPDFRDPYKLPRVACTVTRLKRNQERVAKTENTIAAESWSIEHCRWIVSGHQTFGKISVWTTFKDFITRFQTDVWECCCPEINSPALENVLQSQAISCPREFQCILHWMSIYRAIHCRNCPHTVVW